MGPSGKIDQNAGYQYRRLMQNVVTGVYECNSRCSCRVTCLNRVAQRPLHLRLQVIISTYLNLQYFYSSINFSYSELRNVVGVFVA